MRAARIEPYLDCGGLTPLLRWTSNFVKENSPLISEYEHRRQAAVLKAASSRRTPHWPDSEGGPNE